MTETLYSGQVAMDDLPKLITACDFSPDALMLIEQIPEQIVIRRSERENLLRFEHFDASTAFGDYTSGRVFREDTELRWERQGRSMHVVYLGNPGNSVTLRDYKLKEREAVLNELRPADKPSTYCLFGKRLAAGDLQKIRSTATAGPYFAEVRIPRLLYYPDNTGKGPYVWLKVREYLDHAGDVALFRFQGLAERGER